jgi:hypothetical protein
VCSSDLNNRLFVNTSVKLFSTVLFLLLLSPLHSSGSQPVSVIFSEIAWMGTTASANKEWIELYNNADSLINLEGWKIVAGDGIPKINLTGQIVPNGFYLLERTRDDSVPGVVAQQIYAGALENNGENLRLFDEKGNLMDEIRSENGWPGGDNSTKQTLVREGSSWSTSAAVGGSPGGKNKVFVPTESQKPESAIVDAENPVLAMAVLPSNIREVKSEGFSFLSVLGLSLLLAALSGIAVFMLKIVIDKNKA